jgi:hypothetical protein
LTDNPYALPQVKLVKMIGPAGNRPCRSAARLRKSAIQSRHFTLGSTVMQLGASTALRIASPGQIGSGTASRTRSAKDKPGRYSGSSHKANTKMDAAIPRPIQSSISSARSCRSSSMAQAPGIGGSTSGGIRARALLAEPASPPRLNRGSAARELSHQPLNEPL